MTRSPAIVRVDLALPIVIPPYLGAPMVVMVPDTYSESQAQALVDEYARGAA